MQNVKANYILTLMNSFTYILINSSQFFSVLITTIY